MTLIVLCVSAAGKAFGRQPRTRRGRPHLRTNAAANSWSVNAGKEGHIPVLQLFLTFW